MTAITAYSPFARDVQEDPYPFYAWLRQEHPVYYNERFDFWALSRYADVVQAARNHAVFSSVQGVGPDKRYGLSMITNDPPIHTRLRRLVNRAFTPPLIGYSRMANFRVLSLPGPGTLLLGIAWLLGPIAILLEMRAGKAAGRARRAA